jgi:hypothetical protein
VYLWQGEERDSSDEEWDADYAAMDPISQLGWGHKEVEVEGPAAQLVRDAFVASDAIHDVAMSHMGGNNSVGVECGDSVDVALQSSSSPSTSVNMELEVINDGNIQGEWFCLYRNVVWLCTNTRLVAPDKSPSCPRHWDINSMVLGNAYGELALQMMNHISAMVTQAVVRRWTVVMRRQWLGTTTLIGRETTGGRIMTVSGQFMMSPEPLFFVVPIYPS